MAQLPPFDKEDMKRRMKGAVATLKHEFAGLRTGRANPAILEPVMVEAYGNPMPLNQVGTISAPEPRLLTVQVWDKGLAKAVDKGSRDQRGPASQTVRRIAEDDGRKRARSRSRARGEGPGNYACVRGRQAVWKETTFEKTHIGRWATRGGSCKPSSPACRHHHGRQWPVGEEQASSAGGRPR